MRRILEFLRFAKRARLQSPEARCVQPRQSAAPLADTQRSPVVRQGTLDHAQAVAALKRARWQSVDPDAPEFGGLIEPRTAYQRGLMPEPYRPGDEVPPSSGQSQEYDPGAGAEDSRCEFEPADDR